MSNSKKLLPPLHWRDRRIHLVTGTHGLGVGAKEVGGDSLRLGDGDGYHGLGWEYSGFFPQSLQSPEVPLIDGAQQLSLETNQHRSPGHAAFMGSAPRPHRHTEKIRGKVRNGFEGKTVPGSAQRN